MKIGKAKLRSSDGEKFYTLDLEDLVRLVAPALQEFAGDRATEALPALQRLFSRPDGWSISRPVKEAIDQFIATP